MAPTRRSPDTPFADKIDITALDPVRRETSVDEIRRAADAAAALGAIRFVIHPGPEGGRGEAEDRLARMEHAKASTKWPPIAAASASTC